MIFVIPMDVNLVIMEGSLLSKIFLLQWMVALSLWKVVCCREFCYSNGWYPCHYGRFLFVEIFVTPMDASLVIMEGSLSSKFFILQWIVALSLWNVVSCGYLGYSNDGTLVIKEDSLLLRFLSLQWMLALSL